MSEKEIKDLKSLYEKGLISKEAYEEAVSKLENKDSATEIHQLKKELEDLKKKRKELKENKISNEDSQTTKNSDNSLYTELRKSCKQEGKYKRNDNF